MTDKFAGGEKRKLIGSTKQERGEEAICEFDLFCICWSYALPQSCPDSEHDVLVVFVSQL